MMDLLRKKWRDQMMSDHPWRMSLNRDLAQGILNGVWVELPSGDEAPYGAYFKPTCRCSFPAAAREKIAADLAYDLNVPAVPVLLCDSNNRFHSEQKQCCVSLVTHPQADPWTLIFTEAILGTQLGRRICEQSIEPLSRLAVFDIWIGNPDRDNPGNLLYCHNAEDPANDRFMALDHSAAMGGTKQSWRNAGWSDVTSTPFPEPMRGLLDKQSMLRAVSDILSLPDNHIQACVGRIPDRYMDETSRYETVTGLIGRKQHLEALVLQYPQAGSERTPC